MNLHKQNTKNSIIKLFENHNTVSALSYYVERMTSYLERSTSVPRMDALCQSLNVHWLMRDRRIVSYTSLQWVKKLIKISFFQNFVKKEVFYGP